MFQDGLDVKELPILVRRIVATDLTYFNLTPGIMICFLFIPGSAHGMQSESLSEIAI